MSSAVLRVDDRLENQSSIPSRDDVLARYRHLRKIGKRHHSAVLGFLSPDAILVQARRLGLASGRTIVAESEDELTLAFDLAIYTASAGRSRAIDRYARSAQFAQGSDEALMLEAMRNARFAIMAMQERHPAAGLLVTDIFRQVDLWLVDEGLEQSLPEGAIFAIRYYKPADFVATAGVCIPLSLDLLEESALMVPQLGRLSLAEAAADRRFAEAVYRVAIAEGVMEEVEYRDAGDVPHDPRSRL